jgi:hypothetical protein
MARERTYIDLDAGRLVAASIVVEGTRARVRALDVSATTDVSDAEAVGRWLRDRLDGAKIGRSGVTHVVPRGEVVLKSLTLPPGAADEAELAAMVRLQLSRQLTMSVDGTAIDFEVESVSEGGRDGGRGAESGDGVVVGGAGSSVVMAGAVPSDRVEWWKVVMQGAQARVAQTRLKAFGAAALVAGVEHGAAGDGTEDEVVLVVAPGASTVDFVGVRRGRVVSTRSAAIPLPEAVESRAAAGAAGAAGVAGVVGAAGAAGAAGVVSAGVVGAAATGAATGVATGAEVVPVGDGGASTALKYPERVALEAKRAAMAHASTRGHSGAQTPGPSRVVVLGQGAIASAVATACGSALGVASTTVDAMASVDFAPDVDERWRLVALPLAGCALAEARGSAGLDFSRVRTPRDRWARTREFVLAGVMAAIVAAGATFVVGDMGSREREGTMRELASLEKNLRDRLVQAQADDARLRHIRLSRGASSDLVTHAAAVVDLLPDSTRARLDTFGVTVDPRVTVKPGPSYSAVEWASAARIAFTLGGTMTDPDADAELRERVLASGVYGMEMMGPDTPEKFALRIVARQRPAGAPSGATGSAAKAPDATPTETPSSGERAEGGS